MWHYGEIPEAGEAAAGCGRPAVQQGGEDRSGQLRLKDRVKQGGFLKPRAMGGQGGMWTAGDHTRLGCPALSSLASPSCTRDCSRAMTEHLTNTAEKRQGYFDSWFEGTEHRAGKAQWQECEVAAHTRQWLTHGSGSHSGSREINTCAHFSLSFLFSSEPQPVGLPPFR